MAKDWNSPQRHLTPRCEQAPISPLNSLTRCRWPIRNCSLMLFKALIERLLGSDEAQDWKERDRSRTSRFSYNNYPRLVGILQGLLDPEGPVKKSLEAPDSNAPMDLHGAEGVFPALQILRQAAPPEETRATMLSSTMRLLGSPHWHLRDMAARTVTTLLHPNELLGTIKDLLARVGDGANGQHGALLCAKYTLRKMLQTQGSVHTPIPCPTHRTADPETASDCIVNSDDCTTDHS